ncbi:MAG: putative hydrolase [Candidatus Solibacter sp.]|nr:putative hydrolase [Candidatus Solibacter sp.]
MAAASVPPAAFGARHNPAPRIRLVILDIGGTLIEDRGNVPEALRRSLSNHGIDSTPEEISRLRGASKREMIRHFVEHQTLPANADRDKLTSTVYDEFTAELIAAYQSVPPIAGAEDAIRELRDKGYLVATTTGFDRAITESIFGRLGWKKYFAATICSDDVALGRPSPFMLFHAMEAARVDSVAEAVAVGDTPLDLQAGTNAGLRGVVGVLTGASTAEKLRREPHTHILPSVASLPALLAKF